MPPPLSLYVYFYRKPQKSSSTNGQAIEREGGGEGGSRDIKEHELLLNFLNTYKKVPMVIKLEGGRGERP